MPFLPPNQQCQSTEGTKASITHTKKIPLFDACKITTNAKFVNTLVLPHLSQNIRQRLVKTYSKEIFIMYVCWLQQ